MSINYLICLVVLCVSLSANSQTQLKGSIKDKVTQEALPGAILYFPDLKSSSISNTEGSFEINHLPAIKTILQVRLLGYQTVIKTIDLSLHIPIVIEMEQAHIEANEVVVTGVSKATEIKRNPVPMVSINQKYLGPCLTH